MGHLEIYPSDLVEFIVCTIKYYKEHYIYLPEHILDMLERYGKHLSKYQIDEINDKVGDFYKNKEIT